MKIVLLELYGWATFGSVGLSGHTNERGVLQYLFNELPATNHQSGVFTLSVFIQGSWGILETARNNKLKVPGTPFPEAVDARDPAARCIRGRWRCVYVGYALRSINKIYQYKGLSHTYGYASEGRTNVTPSAGLRTLYSMCTVRGANSSVGRVDAPGVCGSGVAATISQ